MRSTTDLIIGIIVFGMIFLGFILLTIITGGK